MVKEDEYGLYLCQKSSRGQHHPAAVLDENNLCEDLSDKEKTEIN